LHGTWEPVVLMTREKFKWRTHKSESTKAGHRGGATRSSVEGSVMESEQRGCIVWLYWLDQPVMGGIL
jgi:RNA-directed DNA polymerase